MSKKLPPNPYEPQGMPKETPIKWVPLYGDKTPYEPSIPVREKE